MRAHAPQHTDCPLDAPCSVDRRALTIWPGLDRRALARCRHEIGRIARLVGRGTNLPEPAIRTLLAQPPAPPNEPDYWFG